MMKLMAKLLIGFLGVAAIVLLAGLIGIYSANTLGRNADLILDEKVPVKDVSMEAIISVISGRDAAGEYMLNTEGLGEIRDEIEEAIGDFDMWISMVKYGTESPEFKTSSAGQMYAKDGLDIVVPQGSAEMIFLADEADRYHEAFTEASLELVKSRDAELASYVSLDTQMATYDTAFTSIDESLAIYEKDREEWEAGDAALNWQVILAKQKAIVEEYAGFSRTDLTRQREFKDEFGALTPDYLEQTQFFSADLKAKYATFLDAANGVFDEKDQALINADATKSFMEGLDTASEEAEALLDQLELMADSDMAETMSQADATQRFVFALLIVSVVAGVIVAVIVGILLSLMISKPLRLSTIVAQRIANGDLTVEKPKAKTKDEVGMLAKSFGEMLDSLNEIMGQVTIAIEQVSSGSNQVSQSGQALSQGATEQASSLEEVSSSLNEINSQSKQNSDNATEANALAKTAVENAENGNNQMQQLVEGMGKINESSDEITKVVKVIDDIAFQINLLALNANVEAARAGKYGKGFAVVADEVRNLAVRSADAVKETTNMVKVVTKNIEDGTQAAEATAKQLVEIVGVSTKVAEFLGEIALASKEQAQGVAQINSGLEQIDQVTQSNTASAEESASAAEELSSQAQQLKGMMSRFKLSGNGRQKLVDTPAREFVPAGVREGSTNGGNGGNKNKQKQAIAVGVADKAVDPKEVIKLDDDKFGKF
jgi:methyl-accepting chemotaxis protein